MIVLVFGEVRELRTDGRLACEPEVHDAVKQDRQLWKSMPLAGSGYQGGRRPCEVRNCVCGSTMYKPVSAIEQENLDAILKTC